MKFGLFDHVDRSDLPLARQFDNRLEFIAAADEAGFYCYHVAEHHATPLNMVPVPGVYLGAVARVTRHIRLGPLVYLLPLYSPLRLIEEVGILDHLCHGRLEIGVGRGVSPFELNFHNIDPETSREVFREALEVLIAGMTHDRLTHSGKHYSYDNVPMELRPLQQPHPPIWYPSSNEVGSAFSGESGFNFSTLGAIEPAKKNIDAYKAAYARRGAPEVPGSPFPGGTAIAVNRHVVIADTEEDALRIARPAYETWYASLTKLERENVAGPKITGAMFKDPLEARGKGATIIGTPDTVRAELARHIDMLGVNYVILGFYFGTLAHADAMRSLDLFAREVMPKLAHL